jgi:hypothetical protein
MEKSGEVLRKFYDAVAIKDIEAAEKFLSDDLVFYGLFETYNNAKEYLTALAGLLSITVRLDVKTIISEKDQASVFFELETKAPAEARTLVAEWHQIKDGKIIRVRSAFDGRPFAKMFGADPSK